MLLFILVHFFPQNYSSNGNVESVSKQWYQIITKFKVEMMVINAIYQMVFIQKITFFLNKLIHKLIHFLALTLCTTPYVTLYMCVSLFWEACGCIKWYWGLSGHAGVDGAGLERSTWCMLPLWGRVTNMKFVCFLFFIFINLFFPLYNMGTKLHIHVYIIFPPIVVLRCKYLDNRCKGCLQIVSALRRQLIDSPFTLINK